jgi:hypothetical protein
VRVAHIKNDHIRNAILDRRGCFIFNHGDEARGEGWNEHTDDTGYRESLFNWGKHEDFTRRRAHHQDESYRESEYVTAWTD